MHRHLTVPFSFTSVRLFLISIAVLIMSCTTLQELRTLPPQTKELKKDAFCVYSKLTGNAITKQTCPLCAKIIWNSNWNPINKNGEIFAFTPDYGDYAILFNVYDLEQITIIEMRVNDRYSRYIEIAKDILSKTDFSACNDK